MAYLSTGVSTVYLIIVKGKISPLSHALLRGFHRTIHIAVWLLIQYILSRLPRQIVPFYRSSLFRRISVISSAIRSFVGWAVRVAVSRRRSKIKSSYPRRIEIFCSHLRRDIILQTRIRFRPSAPPNSQVISGGRWPFKTGIDVRPSTLFVRSWWNLVSG